MIQDILCALAVTELCKRFPCNPDFEPPAHLLDEDGSPPPLVRQIALGSLAKKAHLRQDDCVTALKAIGFLPPNDTPEQARTARQRGMREWNEVQVTASLDIVLKACERFRVRAVGVLEADGCLIDVAGQ